MYGTETTEVRGPTATHIYSIMSLKINPLSKIIGLSGMLAVGFLLVVLATALYSTWLPLLDALLFAIAHLPYLLSAGFSSDYETGFGGFDDVVASSPAADAGKWISSFVLTSAVALPWTLCRSDVIPTVAALLCVAGGAFIYATIVIFTTFFDGFSAADDPFSM